MLPTSNTLLLSQSDRTAIKAAAAELLPDAVQLLKDLTDIDTSNPPGLNYPEIASVLDRFLFSKGYDVEQLAVPPELHPELVPFSDLPRVNVFARLRPKPGVDDKGRVIHFNGHVVSVGAEHRDHDESGARSGRSPRWRRRQLEVSPLQNNGW